MDIIMHAILPEGVTETGADPTSIGLSTVADGQKWMLSVILLTAVESK